MPAPVYMDNHATTRVDPRVLEAMLPYFSEIYGNPGSVNHTFGWQAEEAVEQSRESIARALNVREKEIVFTSGATESDNLAIFGIALRERRRGNHLVSVRTEHKAVLGPLEWLERKGYEVTLLDVEPHTSPAAGWLDPDRVRRAIRPDTALVSVMLANNEIGVIHPIAEIAAICRQAGVPLHCDATQGVGKMPLDVEALGVDLLSFSGHKMYGPKGIGGLVVRRQRLQPSIVGGGQEEGRRSGTLNVPGIVGLARALQISLEEMEPERARLSALRSRLYGGLIESIDHVTLNGPAFEGAIVPDIDAPPTAAGQPGVAPPHADRLPGNLNLSFAYVDGEALMLSMKDLAVSSGSACTSANPEPSHVLRALGLHDDLIRASLRFGLGRFNTSADVDFAISAVSEAVQRLRKLSSLA